MKSGTGEKAAWLSLVFVIFTWGLNWPIMKNALQFIEPWTFALTRSLLGTVTLFVIALATGQLKFPERRLWPFIVTVGVLHYGCHFLFLTLGLQYVEAGRSAILAYTTPLWVVPLAMLFLGEKLKGLKLVGVMAGFAGILLLFNPQALDWSSRTAVFGNLMLLVAANAWAISIITVKKMNWDENPFRTAPWMCLVSLAVIVPPSLILGEGEPIQWSPGLVAAILYNGLVANAFTFVASTYANQKLSAVNVSVGLLGTPAVGLIASAVALHEPVTLTKVLSLLMVVFGIALMHIASHRYPAKDRLSADQ